ncbi:Ankyrin repeat-containing domain [Phytophthora cactorum]|nr:Ankyrin repeat-containing domain [Phytophthora cactorum]
MSSSFKKKYSPRRSWTLKVNSVSARFAHRCEFWNGKLPNVTRSYSNGRSTPRSRPSSSRARKSISRGAARQKIKAFIDARVLCRRAERERRRLLLDQARLLAEKTESELMSTGAASNCSVDRFDLTQRLSEMETRSETLLTAKKQLAVQKEQEARQAAEALERSRVQASMNLIASWASGRMQLSKVQKEKTAISASAARTLELEKQKQRHAIEAKNCEISSIRASNFMHQRISQQRNHKTVERIHLQHRQKTALDKSIAERTRAQLVQIILDVKLLTERESSRGIDQGLASVAQFYKTQLHKFARLKHLRNVNCARKIQRNWRRWMRSKRAQELAMAQLEEAKRRRGLARRIQIWWRKWAQRRREQQRIFNAHLEAIRVRANVRKIQGVWRRWIQCERERRHQEQVAFEAHLEMIRTRAYVRKIQGVWRRWVERRLAFSKHVETMRQTASVRKIQAAWRRWVQDRRARRHVQQLAFEAQLKVSRIRANARKIQRVWRRWVKSETTTADFVYEHLESIRVRANARKIQRVWRRWVEDNKKLRERRRAHRTVFSSVLRIQRWWRKWRKKQRVKATRARIMQHACAQVIQKKWRRWHRWRIAKRERQRVRVQREFCAKKLQKLWRNWREWKRRREESAKRIQKQWDKWQKEKLEAERVRNAQMMAATRIERSCRQWLCRRQYEKEKTRRQKEKHETRAAKRIQKIWRRWHQRSLEKAERERQEEEERAVAVRIQQNWTGKLFRRNKQEAERKRHLGAQRIQGNYRRWRRQQEAKRARKRAVEHQRASAILLQRTWRKWHVTRQENERRAQEQELQITAALVIQNQWRAHHGTVRKPEEEEKSQQEDERLQREYVANALKIQTFWPAEEQRESERVEQTQNASSLKIQRNWGIRQHRRKMERQRIEHEQHMAALKIQTLWLKWHHEEQEELERERIRQEQDESSLKIQRNWGISHQRRKVVEERLRHKQNINALKIQKHWRRWRHLRLEQRTNRKDVDPRNREKRQQNLEIITQRSYGRCIVRAVKRHHQSRREASAATKIEAIWKGWLYRTQYLQAVEAKHAEEVHQYRLMMSVLATKVQVCWRQWHVGVRQAKRAAVKSGELCLIEEAKALERKLIAAKRTLAAKRIQRALVSRRRLIATTGVSHREVVKEIVVEPENPMDKVDEQEPVAQPHIEEPTEGPTDQSQSEETPEEAMIRTTVELTVEDWSHRQLPHILSRSVNQILFCHEAATVLQKCVRGYQDDSRCTSPSNNRLSPHMNEVIRTKRPIANTSTSTSREPCLVGLGRSQAYRSASLAESNQNVSTLRLRFDLQMTRKLLQLFEPSDDYLTSEIQQSPVCSEDNDNPRSELRYHDVEEMELPLSVKLLRQMGRQHAQMRRQQLLEIDTSLEKLAASPPSPVAKSVPASPIGKSAASSPSRAKKEVTIHTAVENASVEDVTFLQQRGADLGALEPKTQRNALHLISFSKENHRSRAEVLEFLLTCGANLNVNAVDCIGDTPLMLYASLGHLEFMQKLLQHGADIRMTNNRGQNVLHRACEEDQVEICGFLQQLMLKDSIAEDIIPVEMISSLVPAALTLHIPDKSGRYPLHYLAEKGFVECAKQLIVPTEANFEWNRLLQAQGDSEGRTALHLAVLSHDVAMTAFLLTPGGVANVNSFDDLHRSPVHYAMESPAALTIISRLVQHGANVNVADERGDTPLHWAAFSGRAAVIQNLLTLGADPTLSNSDWETPAQIAAAYGQLDCMRLLLQAQRRFGPASTREPREQQQILHRPASEKTALERLEEAVNHLHQRQASMHSQHDDQVGGELEAPLAEQSQGGYWEELHRDVQLVEESGQFSSEDEENFLFGHDN